MEIENLNDYQKQAMRTRGAYANDVDQILCAALGLNGESGEVADLVKKGMYQGHGLNYEKLDEEVGDILWYIALFADARGTTINDLANQNIEKLLKRYPNGFSSQDSINREE